MAQAFTSGKNEISPLTGMTRDDWIAEADRLLLAVRPYFTPSRAKAHLPGLTSISGFDSDGLEGFARTFLLAGFRLAGGNGDDPLGLIEWYRSGLIAGTDPTGEDRWPSVATRAQAKVEAASIAIILDLTRDWIWETLSRSEQQNVINWLSSAVGDESYHNNNWRWFRVTVQTFLYSVGGPYSQAEIEADLAEIESFYRADGWYADGKWRSYDHYVGWAMHLYPILWSRMKGAEDFASVRPGNDRERLSRFLDDFVCLVGSHGAPLYLGRSLIYRFAVAAPLWAGAVAGVSTPSPGQIRRCASGILQYFLSHNVPNDKGLLDMGWHGEWSPMRQSYSGPGSPYWASKGMLGLALPADHPVWTGPEEPLPCEVADQLRVVKPAGWIVSTTRDGIVRVINHGTDRGYPGELAGDLPEYARWGYSNVTTPLLDKSSRLSPIDQAVVLLDGEGTATHRTGFITTDLGVDDVGYAASIAQPHWMASTEVEDFGLPMEDVDEVGGTLTTVSIVRGAWEVRLAQVTSPSSRVQALRFGGWPLTGEKTAESRSNQDISVNVSSFTSRLVSLSGEPTADLDIRSDASPIGHTSFTPTLTYQAPTDEWLAVAVFLGYEQNKEQPPRITALSAHDGTVTVTVRWADTAVTTTTVAISDVCS